VNIPVIMAEEVDTAAMHRRPGVAGDGALKLGFVRRGAGTEAFETFQAGCLRLRLPRPADDAAEAVILNTGGGLVGGDRLDQRIVWGEGTDAFVTSQAAEKVYRSIGPDATVATRIDVAGGARAEWLPQETILFDRARLVRRTNVRLAASASFLGVEAVMLGRSARGERMNAGLLDDRWRIWRDGRLIFADALRVSGALGPLMRRSATWAGAAAMAFIVYVSDAAASLLAPVRAALDGVCDWAAATAYGPLLVVRLLAREGMKLRLGIAAALGVLRGGRRLPRLWSC
jgi:urease accessory protein